MTKDDINNLLICWFSEQILPSEWVKLLEDNKELRMAYNKKTLEREK